ncbi:MAG: endolytic transglycosylase MltG, partial [Myxococcales bacterium]|nr:endolytic transglycosylase MltG [Myxococcales bacterium]
QMSTESEKQTPRSSKLARRAVMTLLGLIGLGMAGLYYDYRSYLDEDLPVYDPTVVEISAGTNIKAMLAALQAGGIITRPRYAEVYLRTEDLDTRIQSGRFMVVPGTTVRQLFDQITHRPLDEQESITIPEGWSARQVSERVAGFGFCSAEVFLDAVNTERLQLEGLNALFQPTSDSPEGFLFPDTYFVDHSSSAPRLAGTILNHFLGVWREVAEEAPEPPAGFTDYERLIIASIVQGEAVQTSEMATIARVIYNRLAIDMKLQMDPTCDYLPEFQAMPLPQACRDTSNPFSTYVIDGLPPTPINSPGRDAIRAAFLPDPSEEAAGYLYFVARKDGSGRHAFSATYEEHQRNVDRFLWSE